MTSERQGEHPARAYGVTGGGFAEGQADPEQFEQDQQVGDFASGEEDLERFPEDAKLGSFARGQESQQNVQEGTFSTVEDEAEE
jgi:hypothetical protein